MRKYLLMMVLPIITMTAAAQKTQTADTLQVTTTPQMHCANCEKKIKSNIRFVKGVKRLKLPCRNRPSRLSTTHAKAPTKTLRRLSRK